MIIFALGIITAQILNVFMRYYKQGNKEYLYYGIYLFVFITYFFTLYIETLFSTSRNVVLVADEMKRPCGVLLYILYIQFVVAFLDLKTASPPLYRTVYWFSVFLGFSLITQLVVQSVFRNNIKVQDSLYGVFSIVVFIISVYLIYRVWQFRTRLSAYILTGTLCLTIGIFLTNAINYLMMLEKLEDGEYYFYPLLIGLGLEIFYFNRGLHYKTTRLETDLIHTQEQLIEQMKEKEKLLIDKQEIRNKIARDLHDNIGSTLSSISVYSRVAKIYKEQNKPGEFIEALNKIENASAEMVGEMNDIVWAINPNNDSMQKILLRMDAFAKPLLHAASIEWQFTYGENIASINIDMAKRKTLYLVFKEAVNNAIKYAACKKISVSVHKEDEQFMLQVKDDGKGFDTHAVTANISGGNGLSNMQRRAAEINGILTIKSAPGQGSEIQLQFPSPY